MATIRKRQTTWQVQVRRKGLSPVTKSFLRRSDAEEWARYMEVQADRKDLPATGESLSRYRLRDILERYRDEVVSKKLCIVSETYHIKKILTYPVATKTLNELCEIDFVEYRNERLKTVKPATFNREITIIRHAITIAIKEWGIPLKKNPLSEFKKPRVKDERHRRISSEEFLKIEQSIEKTKNIYLWPLINLAIETGMRRSEMLAISQEHILFDNRTLVIPVTKNGYSRTIPLSSKAISILKDASEQSRTHKLFPLTPNALRQAWESLLQRANIINLRFHDLRHEAISRLFEKGLSCHFSTFYSREF